MIKAQLQVRQRERDVQDGQLAVQKAKIALAVLMFPASTRRLFDSRRSLPSRRYLPPLPEATVEAHDE